jgi:protocatechuate 3,4-dioxygenase beta subunit
MKRLAIFTLTYAALTCCTPQTPNAQPKTGGSDRPVGGRCEGCEWYLLGMPAQAKAETTIAGPDEPGQRLTISGTIYRKDGTTPAEGVILYIYHTDAGGNYSPAKGQKEAVQHGHLRGWVKTGADGHYIFHTILPASYPNSKAPMHIHPTIKEPGLTPYYIDEYLFDHDPNLTQQVRSAQELRGGLGIIKITKDNNGTWVGKRDIILGKNIPGY